MALPTRSSQEILLELLSELRTTGLSYTHRSSKAYALSSIISKELETAYAFFNSNFDKAFLSGASGEFLDALGVLFGVRRRQSSKCLSYSTEANVSFYVSSGTFGDINGGSPISIPAGTIIETIPIIAGAQDPIQYELVNPVVLVSSASQQFVSVEAVLEGSGGRIGPLSLRNHDFRGYTDKINETLKVINTYGIINGENVQSDQDMRFLISIAATAAQAGNLTAIRFAALGVPGVLDLMLINYFDGIGSAGIFTVGQDNTPSDSMTRLVELAIAPVKSFGIQVRAYTPPIVGISFSTKVNTVEPLTASAQLEMRQNLISLTRETVTATRIGQSLDLERLKSKLIRSDSRIDSFGSGSDFFDQIGRWRLEQGVDNQRVRGELLDQNEVPIEGWEVLQPEPSLTVAFGFTF